MVKKQVNDNARDGNIEPNREHETSDLLVFVVLAFEPSPEGKKHERRNHGSQDRVRCENRKIDRPGQSFPRESGRAEAEIISSKGVVREIKGEKYSRHGRGSHHTGSMLCDLLGSDEVEPENEENTAGSVQRGVKMGKDVQIIHLFPETKEQE